MGLKKITEDAWLLAMGSANAVLLEDGDRLTLLDAGSSARRTSSGGRLRELDRRPADIADLVFTHGHPDHIGSAAAIVRETGAATWMHALDAPLAETGGPFRPMTPSPELLPRIAYHFVWRPDERMKPFGIDHHMADGDVIPAAGGLQVIGVPGHCAGQVALLWREDRLLVAGDVGMNIFGLGDPIGFESEAEGRKSQKRIAGLRFEAAAFGHGRPIRNRASERIRSRWGSR